MRKAMKAFFTHLVIMPYYHPIHVLVCKSRLALLLLSLSDVGLETLLDRSVENVN